MEDKNELIARINELEIQLLDSNNKLNLNRQYSDNLEEKIELLNNSVNNNDSYILYFIIFILVLFVLILYKKNLVLSKSNKSNFKCDKFVVR